MVIILTGTLRSCRISKPLRSNLKPELRIKETKISRRSADSISAISSLKSCGPLREPVKSELCTKDVTGAVGFWFWPVRRMASSNLHLSSSNLSSSTCGSHFSTSESTLLNKRTCCWTASSPSILSNDL